MSHWIKTTLAALVLTTAALSPTLQAQTPNMGGLQLTQDQAARIKTIAQGMKTGALQIKNDTTLTDQEKVMKMDTLMRRGKELINATLTPEQKKILAQSGN